MTAANIQKVISLLHPSSSETKPITKKEACEVLNIAYNTTRLQKIIDGFLEKKAFSEKRKKQNRGKAASSTEIKQIAEDYLEGEPVSAIAKRLFRSPSFVKAIIERLGIPEKIPSSARSPLGDLLPDNCMAEEFVPGQKVWSALHNAPAEIIEELTTAKQDSQKGVATVDYEKKYSAKAYKIYVSELGGNSDDSLFPFIEKGGFYAYAAAYDLGSLKHLEEHGVSV